jgi:hypothetical protein
MGHIEKKCSQENLAAVAALAAPDGGPVAQSNCGPIFCRNMVCSHHRHPPPLNYRVFWLGGCRGAAMTFLICVSLFSIGASFGFVIAGILNKGDVETNQGSIGSDSLANTADVSVSAIKNSTDGKRD